MPDPHVTASGGRFARDMRRIREAHGISVEDIHRDTMISGHIIESFEQDGLFEHPTFNRVYLRSFVRSYATAVDVDPDRALEELGRALDGEYANELATEYLDEEAAPLESPDEASPVRQTDAADVEEPPAEAATHMATDEAVSSEPDASAPSEEPEPIPDGSQTGIWIGLGIVLLIVIVWLLVGVLRGADAESVPSSSVADTAQVDSMQLEALPADSLEAAAEPLVDIGDTVYFTVIAQERLRPVRIRRDADLRRPYYLNRGQAAVFPAQQQIIIDDELGGIRLLVNGHEYPVGAHVFNNELVLTRDSVQVFLDSVRSDPLSLVVPVDTFPVIGN